MNVEIEPSWKKVLATEFDQPYFKELTSKVREAYLTRTVYPPPKYLFQAFNLCPYDNVAVVILGQDPYHGPGQAHGLSFSVADGVAIPPSLRNIYQEISDDLGTQPPASGNLERWAAQGVLLLNSTLTVEQAAAGSHQSYGWETFTDAVIKRIALEKEQVVFMLWGAFAQSKAPYIDANRHCILTAPHPSPLSAHRGFFGCRHFSRCNDYRKHHGKPAIEW